MSAVMDAQVRRIAPVRHRRPARSSGRLMLCAAFAVLFGVLLMHSVPMVHPPAGHMVTGANAAYAPPVPHAAEHVSAISSTGHPQSAASQLTGCTTDCSGHAGMAMCMAVITIASALLVVRRLLANRSGDHAGQPGSAQISRHASRAPPWATPSLEKLSILRI
ncbi:DUF6153 family protein [Williamsia sp.]|uniref:DUF6153 family protein n=1 Tax=Williamsia sp. TaxID=1872085 RepID=UPI002F924D8C